MKQINNRLNRTWYGGGASGGGGGGGCCYELVTEAALQALQAGLAMVQGTMYQITDVTPDWQVVVLAESTSTIATQGQGIYQNLLFTDVEYNLNLGLLQRVYDPLYNNEVVGELNIFEFLWNNPDWTNNKITGSSSIFLTGAAITEFNYNVIDNSVVDLSNATMDLFTYNTISENSVLTASAATFTAISGNIVSGQGTLSLDSTTSIGAYYNSVSSASFLLVQNATIGGSIVYNALKGNSTISLSFATLVSSIEGNNLSSGASIGGGVTTSLDSITKNNLSSSSYIDLTGFIDATCAIAENNLDADSFISLTGVNAIPSISKNNLSSNASINDGGFGGITITNGIVGNSVTYGDIVLYTCTINQVLANVINVGTLSFVRAVCTGKIEANTAHRGTMVFGNTAGSGAFIEIKANTVAGGYQDTGNLVVYGNVTMGNTIYNNTILGGSDINLQDVVNVTNGILYNSLDGLSRIRFKNGCSLAIIEGNTLTGESKIRDNNAGFVDIASGIVNNTLTNGSDILCQLAVLSGGLNQNNLSNGIFKLISGTFTDVMANTFINSSADFTAASNGSLSNNKFTNVANLNCTGSFSFANFDYNIFENCVTTIDISGGSNIQQFTHNYISNPSVLFEMKVCQIPVFSNNHILDCATFNCNNVTIGEISTNHILSDVIFDIHQMNQLLFTVSFNTIEQASEFYIDGTTTITANGYCNYNTISSDSVFDLRSGSINFISGNKISLSSLIELDSITNGSFINNDLAKTTFSCPLKSPSVVDVFTLNTVFNAVIEILANATVTDFTSNQLFDALVSVKTLGSFSHNTMGHNSTVSIDALSRIAIIEYCRMDNNSSLLLVNTDITGAVEQCEINNQSSIVLTNFVQGQNISYVNVINYSVINISDVLDLAVIISYIDVINESSITFSNLTAPMANPMTRVTLQNNSILQVSSMVRLDSISNCQILNGSGIVFAGDDIRDVANNELNNQSGILSLGGITTQNISFNSLYHSVISFVAGHGGNNVNYNELFDSYITLNRYNDHIHNLYKNSIVTIDNTITIENCQFMNITATVEVGQSNKQAIGSVMSNMEATFDDSTDYDSGTRSLTFNINYKDYIGVFNCINVVNASDDVQNIINAPVNWDYKILNSANTGKILQLLAGANMIGSTGVFPVTLLLPQEYCINTDVAGVTYVSRKTKY